MQPVPYPHDSQRFWARVDRSGGPDACWPWTGARDRNGYGWFWLYGRNTRAPRAVVALLLGEIPAPEVFVCHHCDNPICCNPAHLFTGSAADNTADMVGKGRHGAPWSRSEKPLVLTKPRVVILGAYCKRGHLRAAYTHLRPNGHRECSRCHAERLYSNRHRVAA